MARLCFQVYDGSKSLHPSLPLDFRTVRNLCHWKSLVSDGHIQHFWRDMFRHKPSTWRLCFHRSPADPNLKDPFYWSDQGDQQLGSGTVTKPLGSSWGNKNSNISKKTTQITSRSTLLHLIFETWCARRMIPVLGCGMQLDAECDIDFASMKSPGAHGARSRLPDFCREFLGVKRKLWLESSILIVYRLDMI